MTHAVLKIATVAAVTGLCGTAIAQTSMVVTGVDALREWNLIVLGNLQSSSEVEGRTFVGGDLSGNSSNYLVGSGQTSPNGQPGLTVVGNVLGGTKNLNNGAGAIIGGNVASGFNLNGSPQTVRVGGTISNTNVNQNTVLSGLAASDGGFLDGLQRQGRLLGSSMVELSGDLARLTGNSAVTVAHNRATFNAAPGADGVAVFSLSADQFDQFGEIAFNLNGATTAIVNVSGVTVRLNDNFLGNAGGLAENVIWNFNDAESIDISTAWRGSVLAPSADATTRNSIDGSGVFGSLTQSGRMQAGTYHGNYTPPSGGSSGGGSSGGDNSGGTDPTPVPEAPAIGLFLGGVLGLLGLRRWRNRRAMAKG